MTIDARPQPGAGLAKLLFKLAGVMFVFVLGVGVGASNTSSSASSSASAKPTEKVHEAPATTEPGYNISTSSNDDKQPAGLSPGLDYLSLKVTSEAKLKAVMTDNHGLRYNGVETRLSSMSGGGIVAFCGRVNGRSPMGGYVGYRRFIASQSVATTEDMMTPAEFDQAWARFCIDGLEGPKVWF